MKFCLHRNVQSAKMANFPEVRPRCIDESLAFYLVARVKFHAVNVPAHHAGSNDTGQLEGHAGSARPLQ